ncbi:MAG: hypothetical protein KF790_09285 [Steroidobacteraceae bacterium]|nr:hypothetical protein [Steroidobacteraceae bacterium]
MTTRPRGDSGELGAQVAHEALPGEAVALARHDGLIGFACSCRMPGMDVCAMSSLATWPRSSRFTTRS